MATFSVLAAAATALSPGLGRLHHPPAAAAARHHAENLVMQAGPGLKEKTTGSVVPTAGISNAMKDMRAQLEQDEQASAMMQALRGSNINDDDTAAMGTTMRVVEMRRGDGEDQVSDDSFNRASRFAALLLPPLLLPLPPPPPQPSLPMLPLRLLLPIGCTIHPAAPAASANPLLPLTLIPYCRSGSPAAAAAAAARTHTHPRHSLLTRCSHPTHPQLPLDYDPVALADYFNKRPLAVATRILQVVSASGVWVLSVVAEAIKGDLQPGSKAEVDAVARLRGVLVSLGPFFIKLGQALSIRPDILSPQAMVQLQQLCDKVRMMPQPPRLYNLRASRAQCPTPHNAHA